MGRKSGSSGPSSPFTTLVGVYSILHYMENFYQDESDLSKLEEGQGCLKRYCVILLVSVATEYLPIHMLIYFCRHNKGQHAALSCNEEGRRKCPEAQSIPGEIYQFSPRGLLSHRPRVSSVMIARAPWLTCGKVRKQGLVNTVSSLAKKSPLAFYNGFGPVFTGIIPKMGVRFTSFEAYKSMLSKAGFVRGHDGNLTDQGTFLGKFEN